MRRFEGGDIVRVDIPNMEDPDYQTFHDRIGEIVEIFEDDSADFTGDPRDSHIFTVEFDDGTVHDFRWRDLRPVQPSD